MKVQTSSNFAARILQAFALLTTLSFQTLAIAQAAAPVAGPVSRPVAARPAAAPVAGGSIDPAQCTDVKAVEAQIKITLLKRVREAQAQGLRPALTYELQGASLTDVDARAQLQAKLISSALFASLQSAASPADAASAKITGDPKRRVALDVYTRCSGQQTPGKAIANQNYFPSQTGCDGDVNEFALNTSMIFQTNLKADETMLRFFRRKVTSANDTTSSVCVQNTVRGCQGEDSYGPVNARQLIPSANLPANGQQVFIQDVDSLGWGFSLTNRTAMRVAPIDICGTRAYMFTGFAVTNDSGFDESSTMGIIAPVKGKTLVVANFTGQSQNPSAWTMKAASHFDRTQDKVFGAYDEDSRKIKGGYADLAEVIGSIERPVMGTIGGVPGRIASQAPVMRYAGPARAGRTAN